MEEFFQDFDPLRHGSISVSQFRQCLNSLGQTNLTEAQFQVLVKQYADLKRPGNVMWTKFLTDVEIGKKYSQHAGNLICPFDKTRVLIVCSVREFQKLKLLCIFPSVFTRRGLEKVPAYEISPMETFQMPRPGARTNLATIEQDHVLDSIMLRMLSKIQERRILCKPIFQDFDK